MAPKKQEVNHKRSGSRELAEYRVPDEAMEAEDQHIANCNMITFSTYSSQPKSFGKREGYT